MTKNFVLIHGAWHGGWCWSGVREILERAGHRTYAPDLPGHGVGQRGGQQGAGAAPAPGVDASSVRFEDYVDAVVQAVSSRGEPVVLVGHSSAGILLQAAAPRLADRLECLVFLCAFVLPAGACQLDLVPPEAAGVMRSVATNGCVPVLEPFVRQVLMAGDRAADQDEILARLVPQPLCLFTSAVDRAAFAALSVPRAAIVCDGDTSLPPGAYVRMASDNLGEHALIRVVGGHEALVLDPETMARALLEAVAATSSARVTG